MTNRADQKMPSTFIIIPAYNAADTIGNVVHRVKKCGYEHVIVVDDGSKEESTSLAAEKAGAVVLKHIVNRGYGAALRTGYLYAIENNAQYVVTLDADGQHQPEEISELLKPVLAGTVDISLGSRFMTKRSNVPLLRKMFLKIGIKVVYLFYGLHLTDTHNGFRAMNRTALTKMKFSIDGMAHSSEYPAEIIRNHLRFVEVPVTITYTDETMKAGQDGIGSLNAFRIFSKMVWHKIMR